MKLIHVVPHVGHEASGPSYSVPRLCRALGAAGCDVTLMTQRKGGDEAALEPSAGFHHLSFPERGWPKGLHPSPDLKAALMQRAANSDIIHNHSNWLMPNVYAGQVARKTGVPLVFSPRGTLAEAALARSPIPKRIFWALAQRRAFEASTLYHATALKECEELRAMGTTKPVVILPNGIDMPIGPRAAPGPVRTLLYLGRLHPIKGLDLLLESWSRLPPQVRAGWRLRLAGPDGDGYRGVLEKQAAEARLADVDFVGPIYGEEKTAEYLRADLYILPSLTENFGMTIAEALAAGTPAIATRGAPWQGLETEKCGWWIERSEAGLTTALTEALQMPGAALHEMGARGRAWMMRDYDWDRLAAHMIAAYEWVCAGCPSPVPDCIRLD